MGEGETVRVYLRVRPANDREKQRGFQDCIATNSDSKSVTLNSRPDPKVFTYDHVADQASTQMDVFEKVGKPITEKCVAGYNGTIFAYGQTGSGKTHTIQGPGGGAGAIAAAHRGLMPRVFKHMMELVDREVQKGKGAVSYECSASFLEIYNDQIFDLLEPQASSLEIREDKRKGVFVDCLTERKITCAADCNEVMAAGIANRRVGETAMNRESSRSHCVFTLNIKSKTVKDGLTTEKFSRFNMIDLAGSERQKDTHATGDRLREATRINRSLSALGNVIMSLVHIARTGKRKHVHYRDSKLTFLLKDSLGGNSLTYIIACVSPAGDSFQETLSTLKFASRAKFIKNNAKINEDQSGNVSQMKLEMQKLRDQVRHMTAMQNAANRRMSMGGFGPAAMAGAHKRLSMLPRALVDQVKGVLAGGQTSSSDGSSDGSKGEGLTAEQSKNIAFVEDTLERTYATVEGLKEEVLRLEAASEQLQELSEKQRATIQSQALVLRLRERTVARLEAACAKKGDDNAAVDAIEACATALRAEIEQMKVQISHSPATIDKQIELTLVTEQLRALEHNITNGTVCAKDVLGEGQFHVKLASLEAHCLNRELEQEIIAANKKAEAARDEVSEIKAFMRSKKFAQDKEARARLESLSKAVADKDAQLKATAAAAVELTEQNATLQARLRLAERQLEETKTTSEAARLRMEAELSRSEAQFKQRAEAVRKAFETQLAELQNKQDSGEQQQQQDSMAVAELQATLKVAQDEIQQSKARLAELEEEKSSMEAKLKAALAETTRTAKDREAKDAEARDKAKALETRVDELSKALGEAQAALEAAKQEVSTAAGEAEAQRQDAEGSQSALAEANDRGAMLEEQVAQLRLELADQKKQCDKQSFEVEMLQEDHDNIMEDYKFQRQQLEQAEAATAEAQKECERLRKQVEEAQSRADDKHSQALELQEELSSVAKGGYNVEALLQQKNELLQVIGATQTEIKTMHGVVAENEMRVKQMQGLLEVETGKKEATRRDLEGVTAALQALQVKYSEEHKLLEEAREEAADAHTSVEALDLERQSLVVQLEDAEAQRDSARAAEQERVLEIAQLASQLDDKQAEVVDAHAIVRAKEEELKAVRAQGESARVEAEEAQAALNDEIEDMIEQAAATAKEHCVALDEQGERMSSMSEALEEAEEGWEAAKEKLEQSRQQTAECQAQLKAMRSQLESFSSVLDASSTSQGGGVEVLQQLKDGYAKAEAQLARAGATEAQLTARLKTAEQSAETAQKQLEATKLQLAAANAQVSALEHDVEQRSAMFDSISERWRGVQAEKTKDLERAQAELQEARAQLKAAQPLQAQLNVAEAKVAELTQQAEQNQEKWVAVEMGLRAELEANASSLQEAEVQAFEMTRMTSELESTKSALSQSLDDKAGYLQEMDKLRADEEEAFQRAETLRLQLNRIQEETAQDAVQLARLRGEMSALQQQNAKLIGHQNPRQKIQHHLKIKQENDQLRSEKQSLDKEVRRLVKQLTANGIAVEHDRDSQDSDDLEAVLAKERRNKAAAVSGLEEVALALKAIAAPVLGESTSSEADKSIVEGGLLKEKDLNLPRPPSRKGSNASRPPSRKGSVANRTRSRSNSCVSVASNASNSGTVVPDVQKMLMVVCDLGKALEAQRQTAMEAQRALKVQQRELAMMERKHALVEERLASKNAMEDADMGFGQGTPAFFE